MADQLDFDFGDASPSDRESSHPTGPIQGPETAAGFGPLFDSSGGKEDGFDQWRASNRERQRALAAKLGIPLGRKVEVTLHNGTVLRGPLQLCSGSGKNRKLLRLSILRADFSPDEIASCVRTDG
jgi:hypothetical protein